MASLKLTYRVDTVPINLIDLEHRLNLESKAGWTTVSIFTRPDGVVVGVFVKMEH